MAMPSKELFTSGIQWKLKVYSAEIAILYGQAPSQEELILQLSEKFYDDYDLFGDDVALQAFIDAAKTELGLAEDIQNGVNSIVGLDPTNSEIDQAIALLEAAKS